MTLATTIVFFLLAGIFLLLSLAFAVKALNDRRLGRMRRESDLRRAL